MARMEMDNLKKWVKFVMFIWRYRSKLIIVYSSSAKLLQALKKIILWTLRASL